MFKRDRDIPGLVQLRIDIEACYHAGTDLTESAVIMRSWGGTDPVGNLWDWGGRG